MKKCFNNVQMFKSREDCDKYSKSVSYETLVIGAATTGTGYKQIRRLFLGSADKPLTAVGTLTSLLCNSAKVMENILQISPVLRLVKVLGLVTVLSLNIVSESLADCDRPTNGVCKTLGESGTCGKGCSYTYDSVTQTVNITATGEDAEIAHLAFHRLYYEGNSMPVHTYIINGAVKVGESVISSAESRVIFGADGVLTLNGIGYNAFGESTLSGTIVIPEGATFGQLFFYDVKLADKAKIYCGVENCAQKMIDACNANSSDEAVSKCLNSVNKIVSDGKLLSYPENCLKVGATGCTKCKNENFKLNDGECDRLRWTPAEAAKVLRDDNTNEVTINFKM